MGVSKGVPERDRRFLSRWLLACCALLALLVTVGGITRLTRSGLSIPRWRPVTGIVPPIGERAWENAFAEYRETPEYRLVNRDMTLDEFRWIFAWEYVHRLLARMLGGLLLVPLALFAWRRRTIDGAGRALLAIVSAVALQGALGWWMVRSGLVDEPRVSHLRLAAHLGLAFLIFGVTLRLALRLRRPSGTRRARRGGVAVRLAGLVVGLVFAQVLLGALMAGTRAGSVFPTFPRMAGELVPQRLFRLDPWPRSLIDDVVTIHFSHRVVGLAVIALAFAQVAEAFVRPSNRSRRRASVVVAVVALSTAGSGIATVLTRVAIAPAVAHQLLALLLFGCAIAALHVASDGVGEPPPLRPHGGAPASRPSGSRARRRASRGAAGPV